MFQHQHNKSVYLYFPSKRKCFRFQSLYSPSLWPGWSVPVVRTTLPRVPRAEGEGGGGRGFTCPHLQTVQRLKTEGRNRQKNTVRRKCWPRLKLPDSLTWTTWSGPTWSRFSLSAPGSWIHPRLTQDFSTFTWSRKWEQEEPQQTAAMVSLLWLL